MTTETCFECGEYRCNCGTDVYGRPLEPESDGGDIPTVFITGGYCAQCGERITAVNTENYGRLALPVRATIDSVRRFNRHETRTDNTYCGGQTIWEYGDRS